MAKLSMVENGLKAKNGSRRKRRRNGAATATAKATTARRNGTTKAGAASYAKKNGLKLVSLKSLQNGKKKRRGKRRNGLATLPRKNNGMLGNSKNEIKRVGSVLLGAAGVKAGGRLITGMITPYVAQLGGIGRYTNAIVDLALAVVVAPMVAKKIGGQAAADSARLGGLLIFGTDVLEAFFPSLSAYNPLSGGGMVIAGNQPLFTPAAVAQIAANTTNAKEAAKVAGVMRSLGAGGYSPSREMVLEMS